jgi:SAM-dependent methyltransferase
LKHIWQDARFGEDWFTAQEVYRRMVKNCRPAGKIVEVGCWKGRSTAFLLVEAYHASPQIRVFAVDTWKGSPEHADHGSIRNGTLFEEFLANVEPVGHRLTTLQMPSLEAVGWFNDASLDAVFIDAAHEYESVRDDIAAWRPKVRLGGILAGHDYGAGWPGVDRAVNEQFEAVEAMDSCWMVVLT